MNKQTFEKITAKIKGWFIRLRNLRIVDKGVVSFYNTYQQTLLDRNVKIQELQEETLELTKSLKEYQREEVWRKKIIDVTLGDPKLGDGNGPEPHQKNGRASYVARVAGFHKDIFSKKIEHMISNSHRLLEKMENDDKFDSIMKGVVFAFREIFVWGETMISEHMSNQIKNDSKPAEGDGQPSKN